jgi:hypothetical protein
VTDLERSHNELRAALIIAGREIRRLNFGRRDNAVLKKFAADVAGRQEGRGTRT